MTRRKGPRGVFDVVRHGNLGALVLPIMLLTMGWVARAALTRKAVPFRWHGVELTHPVGWTVAERTPDTGNGESVVLIDLLGPGRIKPRVTLRISALAEPAAAAPADGGDEKAAPAAAAATADDKAPSPPAAGNDARPAPAANAASAPAKVALTDPLSNRLPLYYSIDEAPAEIGGFSGRRVDAAFAFTPRAVPGRKGDIPVVMRAIDLVLLRGKDALSVQVAAPIEAFETQRPVLEAILGSLKLDAVAAPPAEPTVEPVAAADAGGGDIIVAGQVVDADSGLPVPGAIVVFLAPGTSVADVNDDNLAQVAFTTGLADSSGHFASNRGLARGAHYGVMLVADGYRWIGSDDGVETAGDTPGRLEVGAVRLRHR